MQVKPVGPSHEAKVRVEQEANDHRTKAVDEGKGLVVGRVVEDTQRQVVLNRVCRVCVLTGGVSSGVDLGRLNALLAGRGLERLGVALDVPKARQLQQQAQRRVHHPTPKIDVGLLCVALCVRVHADYLVSDKNSKVDEPEGAQAMARKHARLVPHSLAPSKAHARRNESQNTPRQKK